jgi:hypothetical protein
LRASAFPLDTVVDLRDMLDQHILKVECRRTGGASMTKFLMALVVLIVVFAVVSISTQSTYACDPNPCPKTKPVKKS